MFLIILVAVYFGVDYDLGFTHHYDISSRLSEIERLKEMNPDSSRSARIDSLYNGVLGEMEERVEPTVPAVETPELIWGTVVPELIKVLAATFGFLGYSIYAFVSGKGLENPRDQAVGSSLVVAFLVIVALLLPNLGDTTTTVGVILALQFLVFVAMATWGNLRK